MGRTMVGTIGKALFAAVVALGLAACSATYDNHGYVPTDGDLAEITPGRDTRETVAETVGTPISSGVIRDEAWFYTAYRVRNFAYQAPEVVERDILAISFDDRGVVTNIERFGLEDGRVVQLSRRVTTSSVQDVGFLRSILSNFGRINLGDTLGGG